MAKFEKGNKFSKGRPKDPVELHTIKQMSKGEFSLLIHKLIHLKPDELAAFKGTVLEMAMASAMQSAIKSGDFNKIQSFIERLFGKVKDQIEHSGEITPSSMSYEDLLLLQKFLKQK